MFLQDLMLEKAYYLISVNLLLGRFSDVCNYFAVTGKAT